MLSQFLTGLKYKILKYAVLKVDVFNISRSLRLALFVSTTLILVSVDSLFQPAHAAKSLGRPVALYSLQCDETFSCPESLMPRVSFWVEVFSRWDTDTAIFHDKNNPQRVYTTLKRKEGCRRSRKGDPIYRERKRLKRNLKSLADKLARNQSLTDFQSRLHATFKGETVKQIRAAADRIRCQSGNKDRMREALTQFHSYRPTILDALESQNLTLELQYLPFVESAFNPNAVSHVGAAGLWQIMPSTGRTLGLQVNSKVDERYDPRSATYAAAKYFRDSVDKLTETAFENGSAVRSKDLNPFVITSYNYGVRGMERAIKQVGLDYERLLVEYKSPSFQTAVKNFYASFLAARHVAKNSEKFFGVVAPDYSNRLNSFNTIALSRPTSAKRITRELGVSKMVLKELNPALKSVIWKHKALIPTNFDLRLPYREQGWESELTRIAKLPKEIERPGFQWHRVKSGQTACGIAEKYRVSCRAVRKLNNLNRKATIYIGKKLKIPSNSGGGISVAKSGNSRPSQVVAARSVSGAAHETEPPSVDSLKPYRVKKGDTACGIAERFGMRCGEFLALNGLKRSSLIKIGQNVRVSGENSWHVVRTGQTACGIAEKYRVPCSDLLYANRLRRTSTIQIGQRLRIPSRL